MAAPEDVRPGPLSPQHAAALSAGLGQVRRLDERAARLETPGSDRLFPAKLTAESGGLYAWVERTFAGGARADKPGGRSGTAAACPARFPNGEVVSSFPYDCWLKFATIGSDGNPIFEVVGAAAGGGGGLTHVFGQLNDVSSGGSTGGNNAITTGTLAAGEYVVSARTTATGVTPGGAGVLGSVGLAISASVSATINPSAGGRSTAFTNTASANAYGTVNLTARVLLDSSGTITVTGDCFWQTSVGWSSRTELEVWSNP